MSADMKSALRVASLAAFIAAAALGFGLVMGLLLYREAVPAVPMWGRPLLLVVYVATVAFVARLGMSRWWRALHTI